MPAAGRNRRAGQALMTMALAVAFVACQGAAGLPGEPGKAGEPGAPGETPKLAPVIKTPFASVSLMVEGDAAEPIDVSAHFYDPEGEALTYAIAVDPAEGVVTAALEEGMLTIAPVAEGSATITVTATDPDSKSTSASIKVTVDPEGMMPPARTEVEAPVVSVDVNRIHTIADVSRFFSEPEEEALTYSVDVDFPLIATATLTMNEADSTYDLNIRGDAYGKAMVTVTATDEDNKTASLVISVTVEKPGPVEPDPGAPTVTEHLPDIYLSTDDNPSTMFDLSEHFSHPRSEITYSARSDDPSIATATVTEGMLTVTSVDTGTTRVVVTAMADGLPQTDGFQVEVVDYPVEGPYPMGEIEDMTLTDGEDPADTDTRDVEVNFADPNDQNLDYYARPENEDVATTTVDDSVVTVTAVGEGSTEILVWAVDEDGLHSRALGFMVTVDPAEEETDPALPMQKMVTIPAGMNETSVDLADYVTTPGDYELESQDTDVFGVKGPSKSAPTQWKVTRISMGTGKAWIVKKSDGSVQEEHKITVTVENSDPELDDKRPRFVALHLADEDANGDDPRDRYSVSLDVSKQFKDDDQHQGDLSYKITSSRNDVVIHSGETCSTPMCKVVVDIVVRRAGVNTFDLLVVAMDTAGGESLPATFSVHMENPRPQDNYMIKEVSDADDWPLKVGHRAGVAHTLTFTDPDVLRTPEHRYAANTALDDGLQFADEFSIEIARIDELDTTDDIGIATTHTDNVVTTVTHGVPGIIYGSSVLPKPIADGNDDPESDGTLDTYTVTSTGKVTVDKDGSLSAASLAANPELKFLVTGTGAGSITIGYHIWYDPDGDTDTSVTPNTGTKPAKWYTVKRTVKVMVVPVGSESE